MTVTGTNKEFRILVIGIEFTADDIGDGIVTGRSGIAIVTSSLQALEPAQAPR